MTWIDPICHPLDIVKKKIWDSYKNKDEKDFGNTGIWLLKELIS